MKTVGLLTFHDEPNYGAFLQTFALSECLKKYGYNVIVIDLRIKDDFPYSFIVKISSPIIKYFIFERPKIKYLNRSDKIYYSSEELSNNFPDCDIYMLGSDQVWNKSITKDLMYSYFFDFLPDNKPRLSYASSFGVGIWHFSSEETHVVKNLINKFKSVSVREYSAIGLLRDYCDVNAKLVVDPTFLINDYSKLAGVIKRNSGGGVVCFKFAKGKQFYEFLGNFTNIHKIEVSVLSKTLPLKGIKNIPLPTIGNWIKSIAVSDMVITDSYHALCFSIIYKKQFIVLPANEKNFMRLSELLSSLGLVERIFYSYDEVLKDDRWKRIIDYQMVYEILSSKIDDSLSYLKAQLV